MHFEEGWRAFEQTYMVARKRPEVGLDITVWSKSHHFFTSALSIENLSDTDCTKDISNLALVASIT